MPPAALPSASAWVVRFASQNDLPAPFLAANWTDVIQGTAGAPWLWWLAALLVLLVLLLSLMKLLGIFPD